MSRHVDSIDASSKDAEPITRDDGNSDFGWHHDTGPSPSVTAHFDGHSLSLCPPSRLRRKPFRKEHKGKTPSRLQRSRRSPVDRNSDRLLSNNSIDAATECLFW